MIKVEVDSIIAVLQPIFGYPLVNCVSSLCHYLCYFGVTNKIDLNPLFDIICSSWPSSCFASTCQEVQPTLDCSMIAIVLWRGCDLRIFDETTFHSQGFSALCVNKQTKTVYWKQTKIVLLQTNTWLTKEKDRFVFCDFVWKSYCPLLVSKSSPW